MAATIPLVSSSTEAVSTKVTNTNVTPDRLIYRIDTWPNFLLRVINHKAALM